jgi:uncharacterized protein
MTPAFDLRRYQDALTIQRVIHTAKTVAIVGLSSNPLRASYFVGFYLRRHGYRVIPVNPRYREVLGERCYASLSEVAEPIDLVDVFRRTEDVLPIAHEAIAKGARVLWQQIGVRNVEADRAARAAGLDSVMDRCVKIEHARIFGGLHWAGVNTGIVSARRAV